MSETNLTQAEADALIAMEKRRVDNETWYYPHAGGAIGKKKGTWVTLLTYCPAYPRLAACARKRGRG